jgi:hypothetical protein
MSIIFKSTIAALCLLGSAAAWAEPYVDYTPQKGYWQITAMEVDPNHVDEYLTGLRKSQLSVMQILQKRGLIDQYRVVVRNGYVKGSPNVLIMTHSASLGLLDADQARDVAVQKEIEAAFSKEASDKAIAGYEKYRVFVDDGQWTEMTLTK